MGKITLEDETLSKLGGLRERAGLYDSAGRLVGYCLPAPTSTNDLGGPDPESDEDAAAAVAAGVRGRPTAEVLAYLRSL